MDDELQRFLYHRLLHDPTLAHRRDCTYGDGVMLLLYFHAVASNRSLRWACQRRHWPIWCRATLKFPSYSQANRRLKHPYIAQIIAQLDVEFRTRLPHGPDKVADGKPLIVGGFSHDSHARWGKVPDGWARGYKLHVIVDAAAAAIDAFALTSLDRGEATVLRQRLLGRIDLRGVTLRADANYDSNPTYRAVADGGGRLIAPRRKPGRGIGHHFQHPDRLAAIAELEHVPGGLRAHKQQRNRVEQTLGHLCNLPFGLWALPSFVRHSDRVSGWVAAKIVLYHLYKTLARTKAAA